MKPHNYLASAQDVLVGAVLLKSDIAAGTDNLMNNGWLSLTPAAFADGVLAHCHWRGIDAGQSVQHAGDRSDSLTGIARGTVAISTILASPDVPMMHIGHPGMWFGMITLFTGKSVPTDVVARCDVMVASMALSQLEQLLALHPEWWRHAAVFGVVYGNLGATMAADLMIRDSARRCAASLLRLADCRFQTPGNMHAVEAPLSQDELGAISNLSRTSVSTPLYCRYRRCFRRRHAG